jgi:hypothetical protein
VFCRLEEVGCGLVLVLFLSIEGETAGERKERRQRLNTVANAGHADETEAATRKERLKTENENAAEQVKRKGGYLLF